jgi:aerobic-type carbon monoxide dehydrogenase small subunit (CoxS/CutS family)
MVFAKRDVVDSIEKTDARKSSLHDMQRAAVDHTDGLQPGYTAGLLGEH